MTLNEWAQACATELGVDVVMEKPDVDRILRLARDAAHQVARPAAPLTTYLLGIAVGQGADPEEAAARLSELADHQTPPAEG